MERDFEAFSHLDLHGQDYSGTSIKFAAESQGIVAQAISAVSNGGFICK